MATISNNNIAHTIYTLTKDKSGVELTKVLQNVTHFLARKRLLSKSNEILNRLKKIINQHDGVLDVKVTSVDHLDEETKKTLKQSLKERYKAEEVQFTVIHDKSLIGGVRLEANDEVIDLSVKNKIAKLKEHLTR